MRRILFASAVLVAFPLCSFAAVPAQSFEVGGWVPYWSASSGIADVLPNLGNLTEISPFTYSVTPNGALYPNADLSRNPWNSLIAAAKKEKVRVIPTITWNDAAAMQRVLSNTSSRIALENAVANLVRQSGWDGIDIDFEGKYADTRIYFATFLKGLYMRMGPKWVYCSIEARTPLDSRFDTIPKDIEYANDYAAINDYCDRVEIMAYDQGGVDLTLDRARTAPYVPISDPAWAEKVLDLAAQSIPKRKLLLGIATYGYEYAAVPISGSSYRYDRQGAFDPSYALELAARLGIAPVRNAAGELSFVYTPTSSDPGLPGPSQTATNNVPEGNPNVVGPGAALFLQAPLAVQSSPSFNLVWWSDAKAVADKVAVAQKLGIRGVAIFKFDGGEDQSIWNIFTPAVH